VAGAEPGWGALPIVTNPGDQTKNHVVLHVEHPTKPYQLYRYPVPTERNPLVCLAWSGVRLPGVTNQPFWLDLHSHVVLPIITSRGVKYTHDIRHLVLHPDSGPPGIRLIPQASDQKEIAPPHPHDPQSHTVREPAVLTPRPRRSWLATANTRAKQTILVMIS